MSKTFRDIIDDLRRLDEVTLLELLHLRTEDIIDRFEDVIEAKQEQIRSQLDDSEEDEDEVSDGRE